MYPGTSSVRKTTTCQSIATNAANVAELTDKQRVQLSILTPTLFHLETDVVPARANAPLLLRQTAATSAIPALRPLKTPPVAVVAKHRNRL